MINNISDCSLNPLKVDEVLGFLRFRWGVSYELRIVVRDESIFLQMMWGYLEQKSFQKNEEEFLETLGKVIDIINRLGQASMVREWLLRVRGRPKLGRALSLRLKTDYRLEEFLL